MRKIKGRILASDSAGFTVIELLIVVAIIGILSSVVLASLSSGRDQAEIAANKSFEKSIRSSISDCSVAFYNFEAGDPSVVKEAGGTAADGNIVGSPSRVESVDGLGQAMEFSGGGDRVEIASGDTVSSEMSWFAWIKADDLPFSGHDRAIVANNGGSNNMVNILGHDGSSKIKVQFKDGGVWQSNITAPIQEDEWHHVGFTYDGTTQELWVDGKSEGTASVSLSSNFSNTYIGSDPNAGTDWKGQIDNVRFYDCAFKG